MTRTAPYAVEWLGTTYRILLSAAQTGERVGIFESLDQPGYEPPRPIHQREDETFHLQAGQVEFWVNGRTSLHETGSVVFVPRGTEHAGSQWLLRGRLAWVHEFDTDRRINRAFVALPGASFTVDGATPSENAALVSLASELRLRNGISLIAKLDGEFGDRSESYAATGTLRYTW